MYSQGKAKEISACFCLATLATDEVEKSPNHDSRGISDVMLFLVPASHRDERTERKRG
jgi:hypothetical protein